MRILFIIKFLSEICFLFNLLTVGSKTVLYKLVLANLLNMWLTKLPYFRFSTITKQDHLMLFASYPVGYPMLKKLHENYSNMHVVTHFTKPNQNATN
jgi:hypothetical protein